LKDTTRFGGSAALQIILVSSKINAAQTDVFRAGMSLFAIFLIAGPCYATPILSRQPLAP